MAPTSEELREQLREQLKNSDKCIHYHAARNQRQEERDRGEGDKGTKSYEDRGCFKCEGSDTRCLHYYKLGKK
jgi:cytosine/adenosine deaminase-related metal-dependent hydrolase